MSDLAIRATHLAKRYRIGLAAHNTLRDQISAGVKSVFSRKNRVEARKDDFWALKDISFEIKRGEMVGIIGHNGAGKSTLLKILSRITEPTQGRGEIRGRVGSLLEVGTGFHSELTGRENVYLYGSILGMTKSEIDRKFNEIVEFSELEQFLDTPVKHYSSGMYVRLAFAVAAHLDPEILLIDEVLSVGDLSFQRKCMEQAARLREGDATVIVVSHNMFSIKAMCNRVLYLGNGRMIADGTPEEIIPMYEKDTLGGPGRLDVPVWAQARIGKDVTRRPLHVTNLEVQSEGGQTRSIFEHGERIRVRIDYDVRQEVKEPNVVVAIIRSDGVSCCNFSTALDGFRVPSGIGKNTIEAFLPPVKLVADLYEIHVLVWDVSFQELHCAQIGGSFHVRHDLLNTHFGVFHESAQWRLRSEEQVEASAQAALEVK